MFVHVFVAITWRSGVWLGRDVGWWLLHFKKYTDSPSRRKRKGGVFKFIHSGTRFQKTSVSLFQNAGFRVDETPIRKKLKSGNVLFPSQTWLDCAGATDWDTAYQQSHSAIRQRLHDIWLNWSTVHTHTHRVVTHRLCVWEWCYSAESIFSCLCLYVCERKGLNTVTQISWILFFLLCTLT